MIADIVILVCAFLLLVLTLYQERRTQLGCPGNAWSQFPFYGFEVGCLAEIVLEIVHICGKASNIPPGVGLASGVGLAIFFFMVAILADMEWW